MNLWDLLFAFSSHRARILVQKSGDLWCLDRAQEGILDRYEHGRREHSPASLLLATLDNRSTADLTELSKSDQVIETAITLNIKHSCDSKLTADDLGNRNLSVLQILALIDL